MDEIYNKIYISNSYPYLRPFISEGDPKKCKIFLVGINPATPILPTELDKTTYIELIQDYEKFLSYYRNYRKSKFKTEISRTRYGIESFKKWLKQYTSAQILETDVYTYPTESLVELDKINPDILVISKEIFVNVLKECRPELVIIYGKRAADTFFDLAQINKFQLFIYDTNSNKIQQMEQTVPFAKINIFGKEAYIAVCRHFMYYGKTGESYKNFKDKLKNLVSKV
ncbi:hypothetical protein [Geobacillus thermodenitrificans]|uniref:hypothetical protein n=1 Tax=Geobacillus thermodenitrificans TaxID=33940 RepID=UPI000B448BC8|nr:hypothetical protein [Geobacillus thermodenitrificans]